MKDRYGRSIDYLRISLTDRCNLRCRYCMPDGADFVPHPEILRYEEILRAARAAISLGICNFKVTGGEPLVRRGAVEFVEQLKNLPGCGQVTLTTNGVLLEELALPLARAGLDAVNVSIDALDPARYAAITGFDVLDKVLRGVRASMAAGIRTKLNCVLLASAEPEVVPLAEMAEQWPLDVRFIELMPIGEGGAGGGLPPQRARALLLERWPDLHPVNERRGNGPAHYEASERLQGRIGWIDAVSHRFCDQCNRLRLTSTGQLKPCLCYDASVDLRALLRTGASDEALRAAIARAVEQKPAHHCFDKYDEITEHRRMAQIGG